MRAFVSGDSILRSHGAGLGQSQLKVTLASYKPFVHTLGHFDPLSLVSAICIRVEKDLAAVPTVQWVAPGSRYRRVFQNSRAVYGKAINARV